ncbi:hypothetical protein ACI79G_08180 [Geodermatophilus sp. SYSU D00779]
MQVDQGPTMAALIGRWRTRGEVLGDDGQTVVATVRGSDVHEELGPTVVHHVDVVTGGRRTRALEVDLLLDEPPPSWPRMPTGRTARDRRPGPPAVTTAPPGRRWRGAAR